MIQGLFSVHFEPRTTSPCSFCRYIINDLNVNSAIATPDHNEILDTKNREPQELYTLRGYAYAGGGRRVTRVEVSLDDGTVWCLAAITYPEDLYRSVVHTDPVYGRLDLTDSDSCFCWCFWSFEVPIAQLNDCDVISVRCMDDSLASQPRDIYWNATGMMNNWYAVSYTSVASNRRFIMKVV
jgi:nitrate reductase (NAD(P)H)